MVFLSRDIERVLHREDIGAIAIPDRRSALARRRGYRDGWTNASTSSPTANTRIFGATFRGAEAANSDLFGELSSAFWNS